MNERARGQARGRPLDLPDWLDSPLAMLRPLAAQPIRVEDYLDDGCYVVRAELPGVDPEQQLQVTVASGVLTIRAERQEKHEGKYRSEFRYGRFSRHLPLPAAADENDITATYRDGILEVRVGLRQHESAPARQIPVNGTQ